MHERIKELAEQAGFTRCKFYDGEEYLDKPTIPIESWCMDPELKKFAELIVLECLSLTLGKDRRKLLDKGDLNGAHLVQRDIIQVIKHFGVFGVEE